MKIILAMKPTKGNFANNVIEFNIGGLNIDDCRLSGKPEPTRFDPSKHEHSGWRMNATGKECAIQAEKQAGRWPSNVILSHMPECSHKCTVKAINEQYGITTNTRHMSYKRSGGSFFDGIKNQEKNRYFQAETGGASRFFKNI